MNRAGDLGQGRVSTGCARAPSVLGLDVPAVVISRVEFGSGRIRRIRNRSIPLVGLRRLFRVDSRE